MSPSPRAHRYHWLAPGLSVLLLCLIFSISTFHPGDIAHAASITVNTNSDGIPADDGLCTLREAIIAANTDMASGATPGECATGAGDDTISFAGVYTIDLDNVQGSLDIASNITINGNGTIIEGESTYPTSFPPSTPPNDFSLITINGNYIVVIANLTLRHGICSSSCGGNGGAIRVAGAALTLNNVSVRDNYADNNGGGVYIDDASVTVIGGTYSGNIAYFTSGGAFSNIGSGYLSISGATVGGAAATDGNLSCFGGGVYNAGDGSAAGASTGLYMTGSTVQNNRTQPVCTSGGGLQNLQSAQIENSSFRDNTIPFGAGGGIENTGGSAVLTLTNVNFYGNSTTGSSVGGGGLANTSGASVTISGGQFTGNSTVGNGGAILNEYASLTMSNVTVGSSGSPNTASSNGGGLYLYDGTVTISGGSIQYNTSSGGGGGLYLYDGTVTISGVSVSGNSGVNGGGILTEGGTLTVSGSTLGPSNSATAYGGGLYSLNTASVTISQSVIKSNTAANGAGIAAENASIVTVANTTIAGNSAGDTGGGVWNNQVTLVSLYNVTVSANSAINGGAGIDDSYGAAMWYNTIIGGNTGPTECTLAVGSTSYNLTVAGSNCPYNPVNGDVQVADAASLLLDPFDGVKRQPVTGSPALGAGLGNTCSMPPVNGVDQIGTTRGTPCTIGAIETAYSPPAPPVDPPADPPVSEPGSDPTATDEPTETPQPTDTPVVYIIDDDGETVEPPQEEPDDPTPSPTATDTPEPDVPAPTFTPTPEIILAGGCRIVTSDEIADGVLLSAAALDQYGVDGWLICDEPVAEVCFELDQDIEGQFDDTRARLLDCRDDTCTDYEIARITGREICIDAAAAAGLSLPSCTEGCAIASETESSFIIPLLIILLLLALIMLVLFLLLGRRRRDEEEEPGEEESDEAVVGGNR